MVQFPVVAWGLHRDGIIMVSNYNGVVLLMAFT